MGRTVTSCCYLTYNWTVVIRDIDYDNDNRCADNDNEDSWAGWCLFGSDFEPGQLFLIFPLTLPLLEGLSGDLGTGKQLQKTYGIAPVLGRPKFCEN